MTDRATRSRLLGAAASALASVASAQTPDGFVALKSEAIRQALVGKMISYEPPGSADMGIHEEYRPDGSWRGIQYGRGPMPFSGTWTIVDDQICVAAAPGTAAARWLTARRCRKLLRNAKTGELMIGYLRDEPSSHYKAGLQTLRIQDIPAFR